VQTSAFQPHSSEVRFITTYSYSSSKCRSFSIKSVDPKLSQRSSKSNQESYFGEIVSLMFIKVKQECNKFKQTKGRDSNSIWKSSDISSRSALEYRVKTLILFLLMNKLCLSQENLDIRGRSIHLMMLLLILCINLRELFAALINKSLSRKSIGLDKLRLSKTLILWVMYHQKNVDYVELLQEDFIYQIDNKAYKKNKIGMHTSRDDYLINTLRFVSLKEGTQIYSAILAESLTSPAMNETQAYMTYIGFATGATPPKKAQKGVVIKETPELPLTKKKEKVGVNQGKGIELFSQVALIEDTQFEEVRRKSMRDFHKTHPSGSGTVTKTAPSATKIKPSFTNEGTIGNDEDDSNNEQDSSGENSDQENDTDDDETQSDNMMKDKFVKTPSNDSDDEDEKMITDKVKGDEDEELDYTTNQLYDDVDIRLNKPVDTDKGLFKRRKTEVPVASSSHSSDLAAKFLNFSDIPHTDAEIVSSLDVHVHHETDVKSRSVYGGFVALVVGGGVDVDYCGEGVKDGNYCGITVEKTCEESEITETEYHRVCGRTQSLALDSA
nr:hypothetical protein [Tanacetum cinerariifolium]